MASVDTISNMLTKIRNANKAMKEQTDIPYSWLSYEILKIIQKEGYVKNFKRIDDRKKGVIRVYMKYLNKERVISGIKSISTPGFRVYRGAKELPKVLDGYGVAIISTSKGLMVDKDARLNNVGGEVICHIW
ncbi:MAG: 30S ribosomal protein S8 [Candidatus Firestonebacteria bacterium RIFOXYA2_FULL_40_8]|nr:ribosomal protein S8 [uncultured bacterium]OGF51240.1 MAG: 30S ribosomal protein S8 [Candidatus Firestonebacteria bacterium RIFOXYA2_FULL_40_8]